MPVPVWWVPGPRNGPGSDFLGSGAVRFRPYSGVFPIGEHEEHTRPDPVFGTPGGFEREIRAGCEIRPDSLPSTASTVPKSGRPRNQTPAEPGKANAGPSPGMRKEFVMGCIGKTVVRGVVITALAGGVLVAVAGPQRVSALVTQTRGGIQSAIDSNIQDPVLLRTQIRQLESEYPKKIAEVRSDLGEVQTQVAQLERERQVAEKVVQLAALDLEQVDAQLEQARATQLANPGAIVRVSFDSSRAVDLDDAYARRQQIEQTRDLYAGRARDLSTDLTYLVDQEAQLTDLLARLETEQSEFQAKLFQLDAQIDTIARNERMITMMEDRQATIDEHSRYQANSLDQLNGRLSQIRNEQRSRLESISRKEKGRDYVNEAEFLIQRDGEAVETGKALPRPVIETTPKVIEIRPDTPSGKAQASSAL